MITSDWTNSEFWASLSSGDKRVEVAKYLRRVRELGLPVVVAGAKGLEIEWSHPEIELEIDKNNQCHLCRRSFTDPPSMRTWVRIIDPHFPEGFLDKGGVAAKCPHIMRDAGRRREKAKRPASTYYQDKDN